MKTVRFWLDFPSAYTYLAALRVPDLERRFRVRFEWSVVSLPHVFRAIAYPPPMTQTAKWRYAMLDWHRCCEDAGLPHREPENLPVDAKPARLAFWGLHRRDPAMAAAFARHVFAAHWGQGRDIGSFAALAAASEPLGITAADLEGAAATPQARDALLRETQAAVEAGVFGAPFFLLDGEPFWGADRLDALCRRLEPA
ncbi:MAG TPA: 2-hydroxychromene-2-carboxylate isomerase [Ramlibacter sp.]|nr:2-hydroxychromene-2-carboxylate isomerase [Ramlibacter sp.]